MAIALTGLAGQGEGVFLLGAWSDAGGVGFIHFLWSLLLGFILLLVSLRYAPRFAEMGPSSGETERLRDEVNRLRHELQAVCATCAAAEQEVRRLRQRGDAPTRSVLCQSMVTYTSLRGVAQPRFEPLKDVCSGAWVE